MAHIKIEEHKIPKSLIEFQHTIKVNSSYQKGVFSHKIGHWSLREQGKYYAFVQKFSDKFDEKESRREWKVFKAMAKFIKSRDPHQCRSHHHKMTKKSRTIEETLTTLKNKVPQLEKESQIYQNELNQIYISTQKDGAFPVTIQEEIFNKKEEKIKFEPNRPDPIYIPKAFDIGSLRTDASEKLFDNRYTDQRNQTSKSIPTLFPSTGLLAPPFRNESFKNCHQSNQGKGSGGMPENVHEMDKQIRRTDGEPIVRSQEEYIWFSYKIKGMFHKVNFKIDLECIYLSKEEFEANELKNLFNESSPQEARINGGHLVMDRNNTFNPGCSDL